MEGILVRNWAFIAVEAGYDVKKKGSKKAWRFVPNTIKRVSVVLDLESELESDEVSATWRKNVPARQDNHWRIPNYAVEDNVNRL